MDVKTESVQLAIDGLEMGYRVIASQLNSIFEDRGLDCLIVSDKKQEADTLNRAREKMRRALPKLDSLGIPSDISSVCPWTLGRLSGPENSPVPICLSDESDRDTHSFISDCFDFPERGDTKFWNECIVDTVQSHHSRWRTDLEGFMPPQPKAKYRGGIELFRRDKLIYELASKGWTNEQITEEVTLKSPTEKWNTIKPSYVCTRLKVYCLHMSLEMPERQEGRPKSSQQLPKRKGSRQRKTPQ